MRRTENPEIRDRYPGSPLLISCGAMAARLILVQKIVGRVHAGKLGFSAVYSIVFLLIDLRLSGRVGYVYFKDISLFRNSSALG